MDEREYARFVKLMASDAGISSNWKRRREYENRYFLHHQARGVRLRAKYRPG